MKEERLQQRTIFLKASFFLSLSTKYAIEDVGIGMFTFLIHLLNAYKMRSPLCLSDECSKKASGGHSTHFAFTLTSLESVCAVLSMKSYSVSKQTEIKSY